MKTVMIGMFAASIFVGANVSAAPLTVVDANGNTVGRYDGGDGGNGQVFVRINNVLTNFRTTPRSLVIGRTSSGEMTFERDEVRFTSTDCTGTPYIAPRQGGVRSAAILVGRSQYLVYLAGKDVPVVSMRASSVLYSDLGEEITCRSYAFDNWDAVPVASPPIDITGRYVEPFTIR